MIGNVVEREREREPGLVMMDIVDGRYGYPIQFNVEKSWYSLPL